VTPAEIRAKAEAMADEFEDKSYRAHIPFVRRWYASRAAELREIAHREVRERPTNG
jgi:hypothetical protein